jgi:glucokinase
MFHIMEREGADRMTSGVIAQALKKGDALITELVEEAVQALGAGIASAQNLLDVEAVIVGGGLADKLGPAFVKRVESAMEPHVFAVGRMPAVLPSELGDLSGAVGAAVAAGG